MKTSDFQRSNSTEFMYLVESVLIRILQIVNRCTDFKEIWLGEEEHKLFLPAGGHAEDKI